MIHINYKSLAKKVFGWPKTTIIEANLFIRKQKHTSASVTRAMRVPYCKVTNSIRKVFQNSQSLFRVQFQVVRKVFILFLYTKIILSPSHLLVFFKDCKFTDFIFVLNFKRVFTNSKTDTQTKIKVILYEFYFILLRYGTLKI